LLAQWLIDDSLDEEGQNVLRMLKMLAT